MADFSGANYIPKELLDIKSGTTQPPVSQIYPSNIMNKVPGGILGGVNTFTQTRTLYRGVLSGNYVYSVGSPPQGATNIVIIANNV